MENLMIGIPYNTEMDAKFHLSLTNLGHMLSSMGTNVDINYAEGTILSTQRNSLLRAAMERKSNLLMIDADMTFEPSDALAVMNTPGDITGGLCFGRRFPFKPMVFYENVVETEFAFKGMKFKDIPDRSFEVAGIGTGLIYIKHSIIDKLFNLANQYGQPFNHWAMGNGHELGEDLSFCHRCNLYGIPIMCQPNVDIGHITKITITRKSHLEALRVIEKNREEQGLPQENPENFAYTFTGESPEGYHKVTSTMGHEEDYENK
jgi:hypothetical protein